MVEDDWEAMQAIEAQHDSGYWEAVEAAYERHVDSPYGGDGDPAGVDEYEED